MATSYRTRPSWMCSRHFPCSLALLPVLGHIHFSPCLATFTYCTLLLIKFWQYSLISHISISDSDPKGHLSLRISELKQMLLLVCAIVVGVCPQRVALIDCCVACAVGWSVCVSWAECALTCTDDFGTIWVNTER